MVNPAAVKQERNSIGEGRSFEAIVLHYHSPMLGYLERQLKDRNQAEDFVQETFLKLYRQLQEKSAPDHIPAWLYRVAGNLCRDYWRSAAYNREKAILEKWPEQTDQSSQPEEIVAEWENRTEIDSLLNKLPEFQREMIILRYFKGLKLHEIADQLDCPLGTVKSRIFHALRSLRDQIEEKGEVD